MEKRVYAKPRLEEKLMDQLQILNEKYHYY